MDKDGEGILGFLDSKIKVPSWAELGSTRTALSPAVARWNDALLQLFRRRAPAAQMALDPQCGFVIGGRV